MWWHIGQGSRVHGEGCHRSVRIKNLKVCDLGSVSDQQDIITMDECFGVVSASSQQSPFMNRLGKFSTVSVHRMDDREIELLFGGSQSKHKRSFSRLRNDGESTRGDRG
jgi:hypothetical protein